MGPLFPVPWRRDFETGHWGAAGKERLLLAADYFRPSSQARHFVTESFTLGRGSTLDCAADLDQAYCDTVVRALLAGYRKLHPAGRGEEHGEAVEFLTYHIVRSQSYQWRKAIAWWLGRLMAVPDATIAALDAFGPCEYVHAMCAMFGADHPFSHVVPDDLDIAGAWGYGHGRISPHP